jgi:GNAT superfamily N-acetyltransferase
MRLREFAPSPDRDDNDDVPDQLVVLANRWWNATDKQPQIEHVLNSLGWSIHQVESEDDAVQLQHRDGTTYFISADDFDPDLFEATTLDPEIYGEMLPTATVKRIVNTVMSQVDPGAKVSVKQSPEGYYIVRSEGLRLDFGITADGGTINANIVNAYSSYKGKNVVTEIFGQCFRAAEKLWGKPAKFVMSAHEDRGDGVWQHIAQKLGAEWEGSINEISDELRRSYLDRAGRHVDRRLERIAQVRDRLNKGYEIYHADRPANGSAIVDRFEADTPALARQYYEKFITRYESDQDFDLRLRRSTGIMEIAKIPQGDFGDADTLRSPKYDVEKKELPGGAGFTYAVGKPNPEDLEIMIFDGDTLAAELDLFYTQDATKAWRVNTVAVNPEYRSRGLGKALYGIALSILRLTLEAGDTQTRHGQRMWLMLNSIPGVEVQGYNMERTAQYKPRPGDEIVAQNKDWTKYMFPVKPGTHGMRSARRGTGMYTSQASMIAKWTGL